MTLDEIVARIGAERFHAEAAVARRDASRADYGRGSGEIVDVPHEIEEWIWDTDSPWVERVALFFSVYDAMPSYGHLIYARMRYREFDPDARTLWWSEIRGRLVGPDLALRQPLAYWLWCGDFEDPRTVDEVWAELTGPDAPPELLRVVLPKSGPVPFELKLPVYERLLPFPAFHESIFESLVGGAFDVYGDIDIEKARFILDRLRLRRDQPNLQILRKKLGYTKRQHGH